MDELNKLLISKGIDEKISQQICDRLNGSDILNLTLDLKNNNVNSIVDANNILRKFGVEIKETKMSYENRLKELAGIKKSSDTSHVKELKELAGIGDNTDIVTNIPDTEEDTFPGDNGIDSVVSDEYNCIDVPVQVSSEMSQIQDALNNIQNLLPNVKVSEIKPLQIRVKEFNDQIQNLVKSYLD